MTQDNAYPEIEYVVVQRKRRAWWKRPGCLLQLAVWVIIMMIPLIIMVLALQGDITIAHRGDVPNKFQHPFFQVRLVMEVDYRGLNITNSSILREDTDNMCIETHARFLLWEGEGEPATYCQCYTRVELGWQTTNAEQGQCNGTTE